MKTWRQKLDTCDAISNCQTYQQITDVLATQMSEEELRAWLMVYLLASAVRQRTQEESTDAIGAGAGQIFASQKP